MPRANGPFKVLERLKDNAYKVDFPGDCTVSTTFQVTDLSPYLDDDYLFDLRTNSSQQRENGRGPSLLSPHSPKQNQGSQNGLNSQGKQQGTDQNSHGPSKVLPGLLL